MAVDRWGTVTLTAPSSTLMSWKLALPFVDAFVKVHIGLIASYTRSVTDTLGLVKREELFIATKLWNDAHRPANVRDSLEGSLQRLGLQYVDCFMIHWVRSAMEIRDDGGRSSYARCGWVLFLLAAIGLGLRASAHRRVCL